VTNDKSQGTVAFEYCGSFDYQFTSESTGERFF